MIGDNVTIWNRIEFWILRQNRSRRLFRRIRQFCAVSATHAEAIDQLFHFQGRERDEATGLSNHRARWYDPATGRFLSEDPAAFAAGDPNLYRYAANNPVTYTDPTGLKTLKPFDTLPALSGNPTSFGGGNTRESLGTVIGNTLYNTASTLMSPVAKAAIGAGVNFAAAGLSLLPPASMRETPQSRALEAEWARQGAAIRAAERTGRHPEDDRYRAMQQQIEGPPRNAVDAAMRTYVQSQMILTDALTIMDEHGQRSRGGAHYEMIHGIGSADQPYDLRTDPDRWKFELLVDQATDPINLHPAGLLLGQSRVAARTGNAILDAVNSARQNVSTGGRTLARNLGGLELHFDTATLSSGGLGGVRFGSASDNVVGELRIGARQYPELAENIRHAQAAGHPAVLTHGGNATANRRAALEGIPKIPGLSRDEYPFASSVQGGGSAWVGHIPSQGQSAQGGLIRAFLQKYDVQPGQQYRVIIDP